MTAEQMKEFADSWIDNDNRDDNEKYKITNREMRVLMGAIVDLTDQVIQSGKVSNDWRFGID